MAIKLTSTSKIIHNVNALVYGESGSGKTHLCGTAPGPLILSQEGGLLTLADKDIPVFEIKGRDDINEAHDWLSSSAEAKKKYYTICIDSISEIAEVILTDEKADTADARKAYGEMADLMATTIRGFRDLPYNTCFTAKIKKLEDENSGAISYMPSVPGKVLLNDLPYFFDEVFVMKVGKNKEKQTIRWLQTVGDRQYIAKDRSGKLEAREVPNLTTVFTKILKGQSQRTNVQKPKGK